MYKFLLCWRYLRTRYIALASIISVTLGVATMIVVNSVMAGFATEMRARIHGILSDLVIEAVSLDGFPDPDFHMQKIEQIVPGKIAAMTPAVEIFGLVSFDYLGKPIVRPVTIIGIDAKGQSEVGEFREHLLDPRNRQEPSFEPREETRQRWEKREALLRARQAALERSRPPVPKGELELPNFEALARPHNVELAMPERQIPPGTIPGHAIFHYRHPTLKDETGSPREVRLLAPGDEIQITVPTAGTPPKPAYDNRVVVDYFKSGMSEYDSNFVYVDLKPLQELRGMIDPTTGIGSVTGIHIRLKNYKDAPEVVKKLSEVFGPPGYSVRTWEDKQGPLLAAVSIEGAILNILLFLIIAVAGFGILAIFFMIVVEKTRDIGILKSLGASSGGVMGIFVSYGLSLGLVGSGIGLVLGLAFVWYINEIEAVTTWLTGQKVFDERIYYFKDIPVLINPWTNAWIVVGATVIAVAASILPARRAARLHPVESLRYE